MDGNYDRKFNTKQSTELELQYELKKEPSLQKMLHMLYVLQMVISI